MVTLKRNHHYQGIIFDDGVQQFIQGMRWEDDYEYEDLAEDFREYFNDHFAKISEPVTVKKGVTVIRTHCSVDKFPEKYAEWHDNNVGKEAMKHFGSGEAYFRRVGIPTFEITDLGGLL